MTLRHKWLLAGAYACTAGATVAYLTMPWLLGEAIDGVAGGLEGGGYSNRALLGVVIAIMVAAAIRGILSFGQTYLGESLALATVYDVRNAFYDHVQHLSFGFHDRHHTGNLMSRAITDVEAIRMFVNMGLVRTPYFIALFVIVPIILIRLDWRLGLLSISILPFVAVVSAIVRLHLRHLWLTVQEQMAVLSTLLQENLTGVRVVKAFASEDYEEGKFDKENQEVSSGMIKVGRIHALNVSFVLFAFMVVLGLILWYGGWRVINGHITPGQLAQFLFYMQILTMPVRFTGMMVSNIARATAAGERLFEILDAESPVKESKNSSEMSRARGHVRFENVSFGYDERVQVLRNINLEVEPGRVVALLGAPGSGKSTIVHLLPRFYDVDSGRITIDGVEVRDVTLSSLRRNIGMVLQDVFLFPMSIRENIGYGREDATIEEVVNAARVAQLDDYVQSLEDGYDTVIGERGATLSGGQRQRLSIARALLLDPPILVLDDSTSSVDAQTEEQIRVAMESVMIGRTTFVIAHRLSTVHKADEILVLNGGEIAERGTHSELLELGGLYREIYDLQLRPQEEVMLDIDMSASRRRSA